MDSKGNLVLSRFPGDKITIGNDIELTVISVCGDKVRLAFRAPKSLLIMRSEIADERKRKPHSVRITEGDL